MSLKALANKVLERNAERNASGTILFHPPGKTAPEMGGGGTRFSGRNLGSRAVLIQAPSGAPELWVQGVADLLAMARPESYPAEGWAVVREDAGRFLPVWAAQAHALGWTASTCLEPTARTLGRDLTVWDWSRCFGAVR